MPQYNADARKHDINRRDFLAKTAATTAGSALAVSLASKSLHANSVAVPKTLTFVNQPDSLFHGHDWETLNPGYWKIENGALRRRLTNYGDRVEEPVFLFTGRRMRCRERFERGCSCWRPGGCEAGNESRGQRFGWATICVSSIRESRGLRI